MKPSELEKILERLLDEGAIKANKEKTILLNNILALCRSLTSFKNILNSFIEKDSYVDDLIFMGRDFSASFCNSTLKKLLSLGINVVENYDPTMGQRPVIIAPYPTVEPRFGQANYAPPPPYPYPQQPQAPYQPQYQQPAPQPTPYPYTQQPQAPYQPQYQQPAPQPAPQMAPQPTPQPVPQPTPAQQPAPQPAARTTSRPVQEPTPQPTPQPAPQPTPQSAAQTTRADTTNNSYDDLNTNMGFNFTGGDDKPAAGRDFLLGLLNKK